MIVATMLVAIYAAHWGKGRIEAARRLGAPVRSMVRLGDAAAEILRLARDEGFDLIVAGAGDKGLKALVLGSVAERVAREAPCPVLVIRRKEIGAASARSETAQYA